MNSYSYDPSHTSTPYVYFIRHKASGKWYIGSKYSHDADPANLFETYFTSSKLIHSMIEAEGRGAFERRVIKTFETAEEALAYENRLLVKLNAINNPNSLNIDVRLSRDLPVHVRVKCRRIHHPETMKSVAWPAHLNNPPGWVNGSGTNGDPNVRNRKWFHHPDNGKAVHADICPDGFISGRGPRYKSNSETLKARRVKWYTDGVNNTQVRAHEPPPNGFRPGRTKSESELLAAQRANARTKGSRWINNGTRSAKLMAGDSIPDGWQYGRLKTS